MARSRVIWKGDKALKAAEAAMCSALSIAGTTAQKLIKAELTKHNSGTPAKPTGSSTPGSPPGLLGGKLRQSIQVDRSECKKRLIVRVGTNVVYAAIHEFGGTIKHPGGTSYIVTKKGAIFISNAKAGELRSKKIKVKVTKPHLILMPARPYMRPVFKKHGKAIQAEIRNQFTKRFNAKVKNL